MSRVSRRKIEAKPAIPTAREIMTKDVVTVRADNSIFDAARTLLKEKVSNAPVVQRDFNRAILMGFISEKDVLQCYASGQLYRQPAMAVSEIMRAHPVCVRPEADVFTLAAIFMQHGYRHLPVTTGQTLLGIVSRRDVLKALMEDFSAWLAAPGNERAIPDVSAVFTPKFLLG